MDFFSHAPEETLHFGKELAKKLLLGNPPLIRGARGVLGSGEFEQEGNVFTNKLLLSGELGAGKTLFAQGFAQGLGILDPIQSPTFTILQYYDLPGGRLFVHGDLYRMGEGRAVPPELQDFLLDSETIVLLEWAEYLPKELYPQNYLKVGIEKEGEGKRKILALPKIFADGEDHKSK